MVKWYHVRLLIWFSWFESRWVRHGRISRKILGSGSSFENWRTRKGRGGSNPPPSAILELLWDLLNVFTRNGRSKLLTVKRRPETFGVLVVMLTLSQILKRKEQGNKLKKKLKKKLIIYLESEPVGVLEPPAKRTAPSGVRIVSDALLHKSVCNISVVQPLFCCYYYFMVTDREKRLRTKKIQDVLDEYWDSKAVVMTTKTKRQMYSQDYIEGFNQCMHRLIEKRVLTLKMVSESLNR